MEFRQRGLYVGLLLASHQRVAFQHRVTQGERTFGRRRNLRTPKKTSLRWHWLTLSQENETSVSLRIMRDASAAAFVSGIVSAKQTVASHRERGI